MINNYVDYNPNIPGNIGSFLGSPGGLTWSGGTYSPTGQAGGATGGGGGGVPVLGATQTVPTSGMMPAGLAGYTGAEAASMDPMTAWLLFGSIATNAIGSGLQANAASNQLGLNATQFEEQRKDSRQAMLANFLQNLINTNQQKQLVQGGQGLAATQMDPYAHAKDLNAANVTRSFGQALQPGGQVKGTIDMSALSPESLQKNADYFYSNAGAAQPNVPLGAQSPTAENFRQGFASQTETQQQSLIKQILQFLNDIGGPASPGASTPLKGNDNTRGNG